MENKNNDPPKFTFEMPKPPKTSTPTDIANAPSPMKFGETNTAVPLTSGWGNTLSSNTTVGTNGWGNTLSSNTTVGTNGWGSSFGSTSGTGTMNFNFNFNGFNTNNNNTSSSSTFHFGTGVTFSYEEVEEDDSVKMTDSVQETKTGEEDDEVLFERKAKILVYNPEIQKNNQSLDPVADKDKIVSPWEGRGVGFLHINKTPDSKYRLTFRDDTKLRKLIINTWIKKEFKPEQMKTGETLQNKVKFMSFLHDDPTHTPKITIAVFIPPNETSKDIAVSNATKFVDTIKSLNIE